MHTIDNVNDCMQVLKEESFKRTYLPIAFCACCAERSCRVICFCFGCVSLFLDCSVPIFVDKNKCVLLFDCVVKCCFCILFFLDVDYLTPSQHQEESNILTTLETNNQK